LADTSAVAEVNDTIDKTAISIALTRLIIGSRHRTTNANKIAAFVGAFSVHRCNWLAQEAYLALALYATEHCCACVSVLGAVFVVDTQCFG